MNHYERPGFSIVDLKTVTSQPTLRGLRGQTGETYFNLALQLVEEIAATRNPGQTFDRAAMAQEISTWGPNRLTWSVGSLFRWNEWWKRQPVDHGYNDLKATRLFVDELSTQLGPVSVRRYLTTMRDLLRLLGWTDQESQADMQQLHSLYSKPVRIGRRARRNTRDRPFRWRDVQHCLAVADPTDFIHVRNVTILLMTYEAVCTASELLGRWTAGQWSRAPATDDALERSSDGSGRIRVGNGRAQREAYLSPLTMSWWDRWLAIRPATASAMFVGQTGSAFGSESWRASMVKLIKLAGFPNRGERWGSPRAGMAVDLIRAGVALEDVRRVGGWSDVKSVLALIQTPMCREPTRRLLEKRFSVPPAHRLRVACAPTIHQVVDRHDRCDDLFETKPDALFKRVAKH